MKAVIFAAGLGTRLKSFTEKKPKALVEIAGHTLLELAITYLQRQGINEFIINIHHFGQLVLDYLEANHNFGAIIHISDERNQLLETGGGLVAMENWLKDAPFIIYNVDVLTEIDIIEMMAFFKKSDSLATLAVSERKSSRYLLFDNTHTLCGWKNVTTGEIKSVNSENGIPKAFAFSGIHIVSPEIFQYKPSKKVFSIIHWYLELAKNHRFSGFNHSGTFWLDVGKVSALAEAEKYIVKFM